MEDPIPSRHGQVLIALLTLCAIALIAVTGWYYLRQRKAREAIVTQELEALAQIKAKQIANWGRERLGDGGVFESLPIARIAMRVLSRPHMEAADRADLLDAMQRLEGEFLYTGAALIDRYGAIRLESNVAPSDPSRIGELGKAAAEATEVTLQDLYWDPKLARPLMALSVPVHGLGAFIFTIDPHRFLYPFLDLWPVPSATAETILVRREGNRILCLSDLRYKQGSALRSWLPIRMPQRQEIQTKFGAVFKGPDHRGVRVEGTVVPIPDSPWYLIAKIDTSEVYAPVNRLGWEMVWIMALIALAHAAATAFIWRSRQIRVHRERERWLQQLANDTPAYLWMTAAEGENVFINKPFAEFLGTNRQMLGKEWTTYLHPENAQQVLETFSTHMAAHSEYLQEQRVRRFDGEYRWFISAGRPRFSKAGKYLGHSGVLFDITQRKEAEYRACETAELIEGQNRVLELVAQNAPLQKSLDALVQTIESLSPDMLGSVLLLDPDGVHLRHGAAPSLPETYMRAMDGKSIGPSAGSCGTAAFRREPVIVEDIATDPLWENYREFALSHGLRACWSTPIFEEKGANGRNLLGTFALYFRSPGRPTARHRELIQMATQTAAIAIVRAREAEALRTSEERLRLATTYGKLGVWDWQIESDRLIWSGELWAMFGRVKQDGDLTLKKFLETLLPEDRDRAEKAITTALTKGEDYDVQYRICLPDGSVRWIAAYGRTQFGPAGEPVRMLGIALDITQHKLAEEEIKRREAQLLEAQRLANLGSYEWDIRTNKVDRSEELWKIFGVSPEKFQPTLEGYLNAVHPEDRKSTREIIERAFRECKSFDHEERIVRPDGSVRMLRSKGHLICDEQGRPQKLVGICQDITDRKQAEQQLQAAYAALADELKERARTEKEIQSLSARLINAQEEERSRLARELHDDLSQQIAALSIAVNNLKAVVPPEFAEARSQSERIRERLAHLGEGVRRLSHELHPAILQYSGLNAAVRAYCSEFAGLAGLRIAFQSNGSFTDLPLDIALCAYRIAQEALQNVVKHARTNQAEVALTRSENTVKLIVSDNGIGMDLNRIRRSVGLGLTSMRERARLVNGTVDIQSAPGRGTTLAVTLPVEREVAHSSSPQSLSSGAA